VVCVGRSRCNWWEVWRRGVDGVCSTWSHRCWHNEHGAAVRRVSQAARCGCCHVHWSW